MKRFVCHFLIVWLALLSGGAQAHAAADAAHEVGHAAIHATHSGDDLAATQQAKKSKQSSPVNIRSATA